MPLRDLLFEHVVLHFLISLDVRHFLVCSQISRLPGGADEGAAPEAEARACPVRGFLRRGSPRMGHDRVRMVRSARDVPAVQVVPCVSGIIGAEAAAQGVFPRVLLDAGCGGLNPQLAVVA